MDWAMDIFWATGIFGRWAFLGPWAMGTFGLFQDNGHVWIFLDIFWDLVIFGLGAFLESDCGHLDLLEDIFVYGHFCGHMS